MRAPVRANWLAFTERLEGGVPWLYADVRGLITIAFGNLVDPMSTALTLPLKRQDGSPATRDDIIADWLRVKGDPRSAKLGHLYSKALTHLHLTRDGMEAVALTKLDQNEAVLRGRFPDWDDLPACAQMALHSLAWACGPAFHFPRLVSAVNAGNFDAASVHIQMRETTPEGVVNAGLRPRNVANRVLMQNAARVRDYHLDPDTLDWTSLVGVSDAVTVPALDNPPSEPTHAASSPTLHPMPDTVADFLARDTSGED